jgi:methyl-accepting chemotaxis protein
VLPLKVRSLPIAVKVLAAVACGLLALVAVGVIAVQTMARQDVDATTLYTSSTKPLLSLVDLRDMQGDSRVAVRDYVLAAPADRAALRQDIADTDAALDADIAAYLDRGHSLSADRRTLMEQFQQAIEGWRQVRDSAVLDVADTGNVGAATAAISGTLATANEPMSQAMDGLIPLEDSAAKAQQRAAHDSYRSGRLLLLCLVTVGALLAGAVGVLVARGITRSLQRVGEVLAQVAEGDLRSRVPSRGSDEIGRMNDQLNRTLDRLDGLLSAVQGEAERVTSASRTVTDVAARLGVSAEQADQQATTVSAAAGLVGSRLHDAVGDADELSRSIDRIQTSASGAAQVGLEATAAAHSASAVMSELGTASTAIGAVVRTITGVAEQTNLLALNATIEAARAGDAGKGFAVVASEVKDLAQESERATGEVQQRIEAIRGRVGEATDAMQRVNEVNEQIGEFQSAIAEAVRQQVQTTAGIVGSVQAAADATGEISTGIAAVALGARETREHSNSARDAAHELADTAGRLDAALEAFRR